MEHHSQQNSARSHFEPYAHPSKDISCRHALPGLADRLQSAVAAGPHRSVVVVSADASFRQKLAGSLTQLRWKVREAGGGAEAMAHLDQASAEALLLDSWLPDLEVVEFARRVREAFPEIDLLQVGGDGGLAQATEPGSRASARSPRRNELLHAIRAAQEDTPEEKFLERRRGGFDQAAWDAVPVMIPSSEKTSARAINAMELTERSTATPFHFAGEQAGGLRFRSLAALPLGLQSNPVVAAPASVLIPDMVGDSAPMRDLARLVRLVAPRSTTVLLEGDTGTGKEVVARALYRLSARSSKPFTVLNCAAIPEALLEAELFGHTRGAFTGAVQSRTGRIEAAHGGTLFLDEIGEMPLGLQAKLLRFLECGELQRVGENEPVRVDVRVIAATHEPLEERSREGRFRSDLYYRLAVFPMRVPSLAERMEDVPLLAAHFLARLGEDAPVKRLADASMRKLLGYNWPGNVRELAHVLERATILADDHSEIQPEDIRFGSGRV